MPQPHTVPIGTGNPDRASSSAWTKGRRAEAALVAGVFVTLAALVAPTIGHPLVEAHDFRQTQTAFPARIFHEEGIDLLHPSVPVLGEPFVIPFEFPLFQALASFVMDVGIDEDAALRLTGAACFLVAALLLYGLVRRIAGRVSALAALVAFAFSPFALVWSRTSMIEYLATAGAVGYTWALIEWRETRRPLPVGLALAAGLVTMLVKPTTAVFWILPGLAYRPSGRSRGSHSPRRIHLATAAIVAVPVVAAVLWTRHADSVKEANESTAALSSSELGEWSFGTIGHRTDIAIWRFLGEQTTEVLLGFGVLLLPVALFAAVRSTQRGFWLGIVVAAFGPPLVFTSLYFFHDYYLAAVSPAFAALVGLGAGYVLARLPRRAPVVAAAAAVGLLAVVAVLVHSRGYWLRIYDAEHDPSGVMPVAREVETHTRPDDVVAMVGYDWSPSILYYARRRGHMTPRLLEGSSIRRLHDAGYRFLVVANPYDDSISFLSHWRWVGALGAHIYAIGDSPAPVAEARVVVTSERVGRPSGRQLLPRPMRIRCDVPVRIPAGARGTWIRLQAPAREGRIFVGDGLAPVPARRLVFADAALGSGGSLPISCRGTPSLTVTEVLDAPRR